MKIKIAVFFGGQSVEHEISVVSALQTIEAFDKQKYDIIPVYISKDGAWYSGENLLNVENYKNIKTLLEKTDEVFINPKLNDFTIQKKKKSFLKKSEEIIFDIAFPVLHGTNGEDGALQGLFELKGVPYVGCNVLASAVGMDKIIMKKVLNESGILVTDYTWFTDKDWHYNKDDIVGKIEKLGYPVIVKPANLGSSVGISKAKNLEELKDAVDNAANFSHRLLVEKIVPNLKEINCSVLGDSEEQHASVCEEPVMSGDILSYQDKYVTKSGSSKGMNSTKRIIPADISNKLTTEIQELAKNTFKTLASSGVARIDFLINTETEQVFVNEINTIPGSLSFYLWEATDMKFAELLNKLVEIALKRKRERENLMLSYDGNIFNLDMNSLKLGGKK